MGRRKPPEAAEPSKAWLDSYADAMTLLLAFFVLLFAMSELDVKKYEAFFEGLNGPTENAADGTNEGTVEENIPPPSPTPTDDMNDEPVAGATTTTTLPPDSAPVEEDFLSVSKASVEDLVAKLDRALAAHLDPADYAVEMEQRGVVVRLADNALFTSGSADLDDTAKEVLGVVAGVLASDVGNDIAIEGHTDNRATDGRRFETNWELSTSRATNVLRHMLDSSAINPVRMAAIGRADTVPRASNDTAEGRAENRRTEIVVEFPAALTATF